MTIDKYSHVIKKNHEQELQGMLVNGRWCFVICRFFLGRGGERFVGLFDHFVIAARLF